MATTSLAPDLVSSYLNVLQGYAESAMSTADGYMSGLISNSLEPIDMDIPEIDASESESVTIDGAIAQEIPTAPSDSSYPSVPETPNMSDYSFPTAPSYSFPTAPTITDLAIPDFIDGTITPMTTTMPTIDFSVPATPSVTDGGQAPEDSLMQATKAKLEANISSGGTMLDPTVEDDIWNRDLERHEQALQDAVDKVTSQWAKLGFSMPDGLLSGSIIAINNEYTNKRLDRSREIAVKQAELEQVGMFKSLELATSVEQIIMGSFNDYARRVFEASKMTADVTIEIYKQSVVQFNATLEAYKTDVVVYKTQIEAELARAEVYKSRITCLQLIAQIDESRVKVYAAHIGAIEQLVNVYKTEIQAVGLMYEAEKTKIERFKMQVEAYVAQVDAITKKYATEIEGFKAYIQGYAASADTQTKLAELNTRADIAKLEAQIKIWDVQLQQKIQESSLKAEAAKATAQVASNIAAGAMSAMNVSASTSFGQSLGVSHSHQYLE